MVCGRVWRVVAPALLFTATLLVIAGGAASATPGIECSAVIAQDATLTEDLRCAEGVEVAGVGVTLDLAGHTISGIGVGIGIRITGQDASVENGTVRGFAAGITAGRPQAEEPQATFHLESLHVVENGTGVSIGGASAFGTGESSIESSWIDRNTNYGLGFDRFRLRVADTSIRQNGSSGVIQSEAVGTYVHNDISNNGGDGLNTWSPFSITLIGNKLNANTGSGFYFSTAYNDPYPHLSGNRAERNGKLGLWVVGAAVPRDNLDGGGNSAKLNGDRRECLVQEQPPGQPPAIIEGALVCARNPSGP